MSTTPPEAPAPEDAPSSSDAGPRVTRDDLRDLGRIRRTVRPDRKVAGVAGGLARHLDVDPILLRVAFVVLVFFGGAGLLLYVGCWVLLPEDGAARAPLSLDDRSRTVALVVVGGIAALLLLGQSIGQLHFPFALVVVGALALAVLVFLDRERKPKPTAPPTAPPTALPTAYGAPPPAYAAPQPVYRRPRRRGPVLFWFTLVLSAVLAGGLAVLDLAGLDVADAAYPAVVVGTCGVMLLVGAFWGRGGGIATLGMLAAVAMAASAITGTVQGSDITLTPTTAADVPAHLSAGAGEIVLDLTRVSDPQALDGRTLTQRLRAGRVEVVVPAGWGVRVDASVTGAGHVRLFDSDDRGGFDLSASYGDGADPGQPSITLDPQVLVGEIEVHTPSQELSN